jgi:hypothetical protein
MNYSFYLIILFLLFTIVFVTYMDLIGYSIFGLFTQIKGKNVTQSDNKLTTDKHS